ncbi:hypothetical protein SAMN04488103_103282 [Gemmobacter aquatilis]|uniref:Thymidylate synthase n=1 Tax=Gemmobacter aquatilis TaxID=933059 RepID=A0A1H8ECP5_9RHOB|nr:hypothetical protein [Gemmobacter aquatilis]SEN17255.1 hypothetical protein SAMN04488103_103282 [Gemmobacter aquatilis]
MALAAALLVSACGGNPWVEDDGDSDGDGVPDTVEVPATLAVNVSAAAYDAENNVLQLAISGVDATPVLATYDRYKKLDVPGYKAFKMQEDPLDRMFVALAAQSKDGSVRAVTAADGGQFDHYFGGGSFERDGKFDRPTIGTGPGAGQVSYAGSYAAVQNINAPGDPDVMPVPGGTDDAVKPHQPSRVSGDIFLNANFSDNLVNGVIYNRVLVDHAVSLEDVILVPAAITDQGSFSGTVSEDEANEDANGITGTYGGVFGGTDSGAVAGLVHLDEFLDETQQEEEHGVFVLTQCGMPGDAKICDGVEPN